MKQLSPRIVKDVLKDRNYKFMLERGYEVISAEDAFLGWQIVLKKQDLFVQLLHTRGEDYVSFRTAAQPPDGFIDLQSVVYAATGENIPMSGDDSKELPKYLDRIESYFAGESARNPDALRTAAQAYRESLPKVEPLSPEVLAAGAKKEPKKFPLLYYPLLAVILLLLFAVLTTLYMVLLERLFSAFSPEADSYILFMGVGAVLLAIGTLVLVRKWVKFVG